MKLEGFGTYIKVFVMALVLIIVYKTFDNLGFIIDAFESFMGILSPVFMGFSIAFLLYPVCNALEKLYEKCKIKLIQRKRRLLSVLTIILCFVMVISLVMSFVVPAIIKSARDLIIQLPSMFNYIIDFVKNLGFANFDTWTILNNIPFEKIIDKIEITNINKYIQSVADVSSGLLDLVLSMILAVYILLDRDGLKKGVQRIVNLIFKPKTRGIIKHYFQLTCGYMYKYFGCLLLDAAVVFVLSAILLMVLNIEYAPLLALVMGICNVIPYFGAIFAVLLIFIITTITASFSKAVLVGICLVVLQQIDANIIQPNIVKDSLKIRPFWVLVAILIGGGIFGFIGIIVSVPIMAIILKISDDLITSREQAVSVNDNDA